MSLDLIYAARILHLKSLSLAYRLDCTTSDFDGPGYWAQVEMASCLSFLVQLSPRSQGLTNQPALEDSPSQAWLQRAAPVSSLPGEVSCCIVVYLLMFLNRSWS